MSSSTNRINVPKAKQGMEQIHAALEVAVRREDDPQQVLDEGRRIVVVLMPAVAGIEVWNSQRFSFA